ncbi:MAG: hypothetical protein KME07_14385 [Pegethrix bostrychoides GSE-TBD4-15B]|uniref:Uncharacterized protein n=1 Tax=Pegethrix bostrychoides GSE-TBD4-15B TaxID=2839662 RepID=A0A951PBQ7_9CYAN|nr:hypothetical protein [Pegethrix bostrychoides GSE-TBD4-15B]
MNKSLVIFGLLAVAAAFQVPAGVRVLQAQLNQSGSSSEVVLLAQRSCNPNDPSTCP